MTPTVDSTAIDTIAVMIPVQLKTLPFAASDPIHSAASGKPVHTLMLTSMLAAASAIRSSSASGPRLAAPIAPVLQLTDALSAAQGRSVRIFRGISSVLPSDPAIHLYRTQYVRIGSSPNRRHGRRPQPLRADSPRGLDPVLGTRCRSHL